MTFSLAAVIFGLALLVWSADRFVEGASATANHFGMPPLLIGMVVVGFGTSAPEMVVSALAAAQGTPGIAFGNAVGSNITNLALILGLTAILRPISVHSRVLRIELPILTLVTALVAWQVWDNHITQFDAVLLLVLFAGLMGWTIYRGLKTDGDAMGSDMELVLQEHPLPLRPALLRLIGGLILLVVSSRILVWGAVDIAKAFGVSDMVIGLTIVAIGTSLPELASTIAATRKGEHDIALGNILGSNLFNSLAVIGIAGAIQPMSVDPEAFNRDILVMSALTLSIFIFGYGFRGQGRINRFEGGALLTTYIVYTAYLVASNF